MILSDSISAVHWNLLMTSQMWDTVAEELCCLPLVKNVQKYSHYIDFDTAMDPHINWDPELLELRYGKVNGVMAHTTCVFLILKHKQGLEPYHLEHISAEVLLLHDGVKYSTLTKEDALAIPVRKAKIENETWYLFAIGDLKDGYSRWTEELIKKHRVYVKFRNQPRNHSDEILFCEWTSEESEGLPV